MKPGFTRLDYTAIHLGYPLQFPVYDGKGQLLLNKGHVVKDRGQLDALIKRGIYQKTITEKPVRITASAGGPASPAAVLNPFIDFDELLELQQSVVHLITNKQPEANKRTRTLVGQIEQFCSDAPDACLARIHRELSGDLHHKTVYYAWLACLVAIRLGLDVQRRKRLVAAALTANLALLPFQQKLHNSRVTLSDEQREIVDKHPGLSAAALRLAGIDDPHWLRIVEEHHLQADPGNERNVLTESLILGCCEHYIALIVGRANRPPKTATDAFAQLARKTSPQEQRVVEAFTAELGPYPPGVFVRLANAEIALVIQRGAASQPECPKVKAVISSRGEFLSAPMTRHTEDSEHRVVEAVIPETRPNLNDSLIWRNP